MLFRQKRNKRNLDGVNTTSSRMHLQVSQYRKFNWMAGSQAISETRAALEQALKTLAAVELYEREYRGCIDSSIGDMFSLSFPEIKQGFIHDADIYKRASTKLRNQFNIQIAEIQL